MAYIHWISKQHFIIDTPEIEFAGLITGADPKTATMQAKANGGAAVSVDISPKGRFKFSLPVEIGENSVEISVKDETGQALTEQYRVLRLITDRTLADFNALQALMKKPLFKWTEAEKNWFNKAICQGAYNYTDLNRVIDAVDYVSERLKPFDLVIDLQKIDLPNGRKYFTNSDIQTNPNQLDNYLDNVNAVADVFGVDKSGLPETLSNRDLSFANANRIEKAITDTDRLMPQFDFFYSAEIWAGEV